LGYPWSFYTKKERSLYFGIARHTVISYLLPNTSTARGTTAIYLSMQEHIGLTVKILLLAYWFDCATLLLVVLLVLS